MECLVSNQNAWFSVFVFNEYMHFVKGLPTHLLKATVVWKSKQEFQPTNRLRHPSGPFSITANRLELTPGILSSFAYCKDNTMQASIWYSRSHIEIIKSRQLALPPIQFLWVNAICVHEEAFMTYVFLSLLHWNKLNLTVQHLIKLVWRSSFSAKYLLCSSTLLVCLCGTVLVWLTIFYNHFG